MSLGLGLSAGGLTLTMGFKANEEGPLVNGHVDIYLLAVLATIWPSFGLFPGTRKDGGEFDLGWGGTHSRRRL